MNLEGQPVLSNVQRPDNLITQLLNTDHLEDLPGSVSELKVEYDKYGKNKSCHDSPNDPLVPVHPL